MGKHHGMALKLSMLAMASLSMFCRADILPVHRHVQTKGVLTCAEQDGNCRIDTCETGERKKVFEVKCDSGCGYWRGRCGQVCCVKDPEEDIEQDNSAKATS